MPIIVTVVIIVSLVIIRYSQLFIFFLRLFYLFFCFTLTVVIFFFKNCFLLNHFLSFNCQWTRRCRHYLSVKTYFKLWFLSCRLICFGRVCFIKRFHYFRYLVVVVVVHHLFSPDSGSIGCCCCCSEGLWVFGRICNSRELVDAIVKQIRIVVAVVVNIIGYWRGFHCCFHRN